MPVLREMSVLNKDVNTPNKVISDKGAVRDLESWMKLDKNQNDRDL